MTDTQEVKAMLMELATDEGWTWERLDAAVSAAMSEIEDAVEASACGMEERADNALMRRQEDETEARECPTVPE